MLGKVLLAGLVMLLGAGAIEAQPAAPAGGGPGQGPAQVQSKDQVDLKLQDALRERDAIIRNLLERVSELEWRGERRIYERRQHE